MGKRSGSGITPDGERTTKRRGTVRMSGLFVIAELDAFRVVLGKVQRGEGETVTMWCRSTITNAVHRIGPSGPVKAAAETAWRMADQLAAHLDMDVASDATIEEARHRALEALDGLVAAVRLSKTAGPAEAQ